MGSITTRQRRPRPPYRPAMPRGVNGEVWRRALVDRERSGRVALEDLAEDDSEVESDPTPREIAQRAAEIRDAWDPATELERRMGGYGVLSGVECLALVLWRPPIIATADIAATSIAG